MFFGLILFGRVLTIIFLRTQMIRKRARSGASADPARRRIPAKRRRIGAGVFTAGGALIKPRQRQNPVFEPELKNLDLQMGFTFDSTLEIPTTGQLSMIAQGDDANSRDGRQVIIKSLQIHGQLAYAPAAGVIGAVVPTSVSLWLCLDTQTNGAAATPADVITVTGTTPVNWVKNLDNDKRFQILKHWRWDFGPTGSWVAPGGGRLQLLSMEDYFLRMNLPVTFNGTAAAISSISTNNLFILAQADTDDLVTFTGRSRIRFVG